MCVWVETRPFMAYLFLQMQPHEVEDREKQRTRMEYVQQSDHQKKMRKKYNPEQHKNVVIMKTKN